MYVEINGIVSEVFQLLFGVPQGSIMGPILFIIHINDAPMIENVQVSLFADEITIYTVSKLLSAIIKRLQKALDRKRRYFYKWMIKLNEFKIGAIIFTKRRPNINKYINIDNFEIKWNKNVKYLGVMLDNRLYYHAHLKSIIQKSIPNQLI